LSRRVVITGIGLVSSLGIGTEANWKALLIGTSGVDRVTKFDVTGYAAQIAAEVRGFDPLDFVEKKRRQEDGRLHSVRHRGLAVRDG
jgi:3-oxoacyl-[acyl-carrier-protein] synthase II